MGRAIQVIRLLRNPTQRQHVFRWLRSLKKDYLIKEKQPWLAFDAIRFLRSLPFENKQVFEYGSGGSTLYWLRRGARVTSVEHDAAWYRALRDQLPGGAALDYRLVLPEQVAPLDPDPSNPDGYASADESFSRHSFVRYCSQIDEFPDNYFDLVLIDGRARPSCIKHAHRKVGIGGILVLDNTDREYYLRRAAGFLKGYEPTICQGATPAVDFFSETTVFVRKV